MQLIFTLLGPSRESNFLSSSYILYGRFFNLFYNGQNMLGEILNELRDYFSKKEEYLFFFGYQSPFSQWYPCSYTLGEYTYTSAEQGMMHGKALLFGDSKTAREIMLTDNPKKIKALGRKVRGFDEKKWIKSRERIVYNNNLRKFATGQAQHCARSLYSILKEHKGKFAEASPYDKIWGIGLSENQAKMILPENWPGLNLLGKILDEVKSVIKRDDGYSAIPLRTD